MSAVNNPFSEFSKGCLDTYDDFALVANIFPKGNLERFECDEKGNFTLTYEGSHRGQASHQMDKWKDIFTKTVVVVEKEVKGTLIPKEGDKPARIEIKSGVKATKTVGFFPISTSLTAIEAVAKTTDFLVRGKLGFLTKSIRLEQEDMIFTNIDWKLKA